MEAGVVTAYLGFDATAPSLHVGSLLQIMILRHLQKSGHKPIVLLGGGTTKVGDPTGKDGSRKMLTDADIQANIDGIRGVFDKFLAFGEGETDASMVNNDEWLSSLKYLEFLRDYGTLFTINRMLSFESVKQRLARENPLTFLEFNYMILQAYDFLELNRRYECTLQLGGSDQWGNMVNGVELTRRANNGAEVFAMTAPLITTSDGKKMGKSEGGAMWLNEEMLPPYDYWQFWRNTNDDDVGRFLKLFTELPLDECDRLASMKGAEINAAKKVLADECTRMLHGGGVLAKIHETAASVFAGKDGSMDNLPRAGVTAEEAAAGVSVIDLYIKLGFAKSKSECRKLIEGGGARINGEKIEGIDAVVTGEMLKEGAVKLSMGKKKHGLVEIQ
uniref:Tyrosine--tRNA ligase n=1 Tax=Hemiselmis tepida TaxID=464990 RepID=A0A7S0Z2K0_9CRYP